MELWIAAVGRVREASLRSVLDDYYGRIQRYAGLHEVELKEDREDRLLQAFDRSMQSAGARVRLIVLDVKGLALSSEAFAQRIGDERDQGAVPFFAIGGAEGLPTAFRERAAWKLSLGPMTLPHRLARVVLAEQVYRAFTILRGEPYAREG